VGFKAMSTLKASTPEARKLAAQYPARFEVGTTGWATARFTEEEPLPERLSSEWLTESYGATAGTVVTVTKKRSKRRTPRAR
jgi:hypothetical protein